MDCLRAFLRRERALLMIFGVALLLRLGITVIALLVNSAFNAAAPENALEIFSRPDSAGYLGPALALADSGEYLTEPGGVPGVMRAPGFPAVAAVFLKISGGSFGFLALLLAFLNALAVLVAGWGIRTLWGNTASLIGASLIALNLTAIAQAPMFLSDSLFSLVAACQFWSFALFYRKRKIHYFAAAAALAACGALIRPINVAWIFPALFLVAVLPDAAWKFKLRTALSGAVIFFLLLLPWQLRNASLGAGMCIDVNTGAMLHQNGAMLLAAANGTEYEAEKQNILRELETEFADTERFPDEKSRVDHRLKRFAGIIREHPVLWFSQHFRWQILLPDAPVFFELLGLTESDRGTLNVLHTQGIRAAVNHYFDGRLWIPALVLPLLAVTGILYAGALGQLVVWCRTIRRSWYWLFLFLAFAEYYFFLPGPITVPRYQLPALPFLAGMSALFWYGIFCRFRRKNRN